MLSLLEFSSRLQYHDSLNPALWESDNTLRKEVESKLKSVAKEFIEFTKINKKLVTDIIITGSSANFNYSNLSDIDLHIVATYNPDLKDALGIPAQDTLNVIRNQFNQSHKIRVNGYPVETYVQADSAAITSNAGVYSLQQNKWLKTPVNEHIEYNEREISAKADPIAHEISRMSKDKNVNLDEIQQLKAKIWQMRGAGLKSGGEYSLENEAFKSLRNNGYLDKLLKCEMKAKDRELSL